MPRIRLASKCRSYGPITDTQRLTSSSTTHTNSISVMHLHVPVIIISFGCTIIAQNPATSNGHFTKRLLDEISGIFGRQSSTSTNAFIPPYNINAAYPSNNPSDQSDMNNSNLVKTGSFPAWIEWINVATDLLRQSMHKASSKANADSIMNSDGETASPPNPLGTSNSLSWWLDEYSGTPHNRNSQYAYATSATQLDTGGTNFDRLVIAQNQPLDNPFIGKFTRKGLDWSDGNLRFVNVQGSKLMGSELAVHDRSIDIPLRPWLQAFDSFLKPRLQPANFPSKNI